MRASDERVRSTSANVVLCTAKFEIATVFVAVDAGIRAITSLRRVHGQMARIQAGASLEAREPFAYMSPSSW